MAKAERVRFLACRDVRSLGPPAVAKPLMGRHTNRNPRGPPFIVWMSREQGGFRMEDTPPAIRPDPSIARGQRLSDKKPPNTEMT